MIRPNLESLCFGGGPRPYGPNWVWNGSGWSFVRCDLATPPSVVGSAVSKPFQSAFSGTLDGSADVGILPIDVPRPASPPNVLPPGGSIGEPVVNAEEDGEPCACTAAAGPRSLWWLVGMGLVLWML